MCCQVPHTCNPQPPLHLSDTPKYYKGRLHHGSGNQTVGRKKLRRGTWKLWETFFVTEMEQNPQSLVVSFLSLYLNPCTGKIHLSFSWFKEGRGGYLKILQSHKNQARCWGAAVLLQSFYGAHLFQGLGFRSSRLHSPGSGSLEKHCLRSAAVQESLHTCRRTSQTHHVSICHEGSLSVQLSGRHRPVLFSKVTMKYSTLCLIFKVFSHLFNGSWNTAIAVKPRSSVVLPDLFGFTENGNIHTRITEAENKIEHGIYICSMKIQITERNIKVI